MNANKISEAAQSIGYAIGVLTALAEMAKLNKRQVDAVDAAIEDLRAIDLLDLAASVSEDENDGKL